MRDSQKSKLYRAESILYRKNFSGERFDTVEECQAYVDKVCRDPYVIRHYANIRSNDGEPLSIRRIIVKDGRGARSASAAYNGRSISLPRWSRSERVILHEIAHCLAPASVHHGWEFAKILLDLIRHFLGQEAHDTLKASFKESRVRFAPKAKRHISPERREELRRNMARVRAAKSQS